mmetsp:Transcript_11914/g.44316  ORF Transcript_11914/g.44316 Transcript_11914/m.44316 type:complete len:454 (+) Transcript_11914:51-1412(+)
MAGTTPPLDVASLTAEADESFAKGVAAIKAGTMDEAIELLARALELKTTLHGEQAIECAASYFRYGCALFYKAQDENTVFGKQAQAQASAKDDADKRKPQIANETAVDDSEACDDDDDDEKDGEDKEDGEDDDEEEDDMELAWKLVENARLIYEEDESHPIELANCFETLGEMNTEHANFASALEDLEQCLAILETELEEDDRRIAGVLLSISVAQQMDDKLEKALVNCARAISILEARLKRLKSSDEAAIAAMQNSQPPGATPYPDPLAAAKAELEQIEAVLGDLKMREEELQGLVSEDNDTRAQIKAAFATIGGVGGSGAGPSSGGVVETMGFDVPKLAPGAAQPVNLGVVGKSAGGVSRVTPNVTNGTGHVTKAPQRITVAPVAAPPAPAGSSAAAAAAAFASMSSEAPAAVPAAKKAKIAPTPVAAPAGTTGEGLPKENENAPDACAPQ